MLKQPTLVLLHELRLTGMAEALTRLSDNEDGRNISHTEWLALLWIRKRLGEITSVSHCVYAMRSFITLPFPKTLFVVHRENMIARS